MTATAIEESVLAPNRSKIRSLRLERGWSIDDAWFAAKSKKLSLSRGTLRSLEIPEGVAGCRVSTLGEIIKLYDLPKEALLEITEDEPEPEPAPPPARRPTKSRRAS